MKHRVAGRTFRFRTLLGLALLLAPLAAATPTAAQEGVDVTPEAEPGEIVYVDPIQDVHLLDPTTPAAPLEPATDGLDLKTVRMFGETGEFIRISAEIRQMSASRNLPYTATGQSEVDFCFVWNDTPFVAHVNWIWVEPEPNNHAVQFGVPENGCTERGPQYSFNQYVERNASYWIDGEFNQIEFTVSRSALARLAGLPAPAAGDKISDFFAVARDFRGLRYDVVPNVAAERESLELVYGTGNQQGLTLKPEVNTPLWAKCLENRNLPAYAIESGGKRGVPVRLTNDHDQDRPMRLDARISAGFVGWEAGVVPLLTAPAKSGSSDGNLTLTVIVTTPTAAKHKDCATVRVRAFDADDPTRFAETNFNVIAVEPLSPEHSTLYFHLSRSANMCTHYDTRWWNTLEDDPDDWDTTLAFTSCARSPTAAIPIGGESMGVYAGMDVAPFNDLILNTSAVGGFVRLTLILQSGSLSGAADLQASLVRCDPPAYQNVGEASVRVTVGKDPTPVTIDIPIAFRRETRAEGDPSVRLKAGCNLGIRLGYSPADSTAPSSMIWHPQGTKLELPIFATEARSQLGVGDNGGLVSLARRGEFQTNVNPGKSFAFEFNLLNEGLSTDVVDVEATITSPRGDWSAAVSGGASLQMAPGESQTVRVVVRVPEAATENEAASFTALATSRTDPTATSSLTHTLLVTRGVLVDGGLEDEPHGDPALRKGLLPGFDAGAAFVAIVGCLVIIVPRRRSP